MITSYDTSFLRTLRQGLILNDHSAALMII